MFSVCACVFVVLVTSTSSFVKEENSAHETPTKTTNLVTAAAGWSVCVCVGCCCCLGADRSCLIWSCSRLRPFYFEAPHARKELLFLDPLEGNWHTIRVTSFVFISSSPRNISERWRRHWWFYRFYWRLKFWRSTWTSPAPWRTGDPADPISDSVSTSTRIEDSTGKPNFSFGTKLWRHPGGKHFQLVTVHVQFLIGRDRFNFWTNGNLIGKRKNVLLSPTHNESK